MFVIFASPTDAQGYVSDVNAALGYPCPGDPPTPPNPDGSPGYGWTVTWSDVSKSYSENLWAVTEAPASSGVPVPPTAVEVVATLPDNWYPPADL